MLILLLSLLVGAMILQEYEENMEKKNECAE